MLVETFGGAVSYLSEEFETFDIYKKRSDILKRIEDNPDDKITEIAWNTFLKGTQRLDKTGKEKFKNYTLWIAKDIETGKEYRACSSKKLGDLIGFSGVSVHRAESLNRLVKNRYKISCEEVRFGSNNASKRYIWTAEDTETNEVLEAKSARELGDLIGVTDASVNQASKSNKLIAKRYKITRKKAQ